MALRTMTRPTALLAAVASLALSADAPGQRCPTVTRLLEVVQARGAGTVPDAAAATRGLALVVDALGDPACQNERRLIVGIGADLASAIGDWDRVVTFTHELLDEPQPEFPDDPQGDSARTAWVESRTATRQQLVRAQVARARSDARLIPDAVREIDAFVAITPHSASGMRTISIATAMIDRAALLRMQEDWRGAAQSEQRGALLVVTSELDDAQARDLGGARPEEFLQRAAGDLLAARAVPDAVATLASISLLPSRVRHPATHARVILPQAARLGIAPDFLTRVWETFPRDAETVLFARNAAVYAYPQGRDQVATVLDQCLALPESLLDAATTARDAGTPSTRPRGPVHAEFMVYRALIAAQQGDLERADLLLSSVRARGWDGDWCQDKVAAIEAQRNRTR
jgi:hypothetical protein